MSVIGQDIHSWIWFKYSYYGMKTWTWRPIPLLWGQNQSYITTSLMLPIQSLLSLCCLLKNLKIKVGGTIILSVILYLKSNSGKQNYQNQYHLTKAKFPFPIATEHHPIYLRYRALCLISWTVAMRANVVFSKSSPISKDMSTKRWQGTLNSYNICLAVLAEYIIPSCFEV